MSSTFQPLPPLTPHSIEDRIWWRTARTDPRHAELWSRITALARAADRRPPVALATDYLAAKRSNDRGRLDQRWLDGRGVLTALSIHACSDGAQGESADRLTDWLWAFLTDPTWTISAHLPGHDLPDLSKPVLELTACEMAAALAEMCEVMRPWLNAQSGTLADNLLSEVDRRVLEPFGRGEYVTWHDPAGPQLNNWTGVCAGSILAACESFAAQGRPRPEARARALDALRLFFRACFTPGGECDEGVMYWNYGLGFATLGLSRLPIHEWRTFDTDRFAAIADYPRCAHLVNNCFFSGNDGGLHCTAPRSFVPWLAQVTGSPFLAWWSVHHPMTEPWNHRHFSQVLRELAGPDPAALAAGYQPSAVARGLSDQQAAIFSTATPRGELTACLTGGHNDERHNHNDLGHVVVVLDGDVIVPDLGAPEYRSDFFGPRRYTYLTASSRGHCCPIINGHEQRPGADAAGHVVRWELSGDNPTAELDLTAAYPPEAGLKRWTRRLERSGVEMLLIDRLETTAPGSPISHVLWFLHEPRRVADGPRFSSGPLCCEVSPPSDRTQIETMNPTDLLMQEFRDRTLYRMQLDYRTDARGGLEITTRFARAV